jgi:hypothetical protein
VSLLTLDNPHFFRQIGESIRAEGLACGYDVRVVSGDFDVGKQSEQVKTSSRRSQGHRTLALRFRGDHRRYAPPTPRPAFRVSTADIASSCP